MRGAGISELLLQRVRQVSPEPKEQRLGQGSLGLWEGSREGCRQTVSYAKNPRLGGISLTFRDQSDLGRHHS